MRSANIETLEVLYRLLKSHLNFYKYEKPQDLSIALSTDQAMKLKIAIGEVLSENEQRESDKQ